LTLNADGSGNDVIIQSDGSTKAIVTAEGTAGIGVTPESWQSTISAIQVGGNGSLHCLTAQGASSRMMLANNLYVNSGGADKAISTDEATNYVQRDGTHKFQVASSTSADATITWTDGFEVLADGKARAKNGLLFGTDTAAANALEDYEEGTWTPTDLYNAWTSSITATYCKYVKIGKQVTIVGYITLPTDGNSGAAASFGGLPFTPESNCYATGQVSHSASNPAHTNIYARVSGTGSTNVHILKQEDVAPTGDELETYVIFTVTYFI
jgi:hypothetical protein